MTLVETSDETTDNQNQPFEEFDLANLAPPSLVREEYSDDESVCDSLDSDPKGIEECERSNIEYKSNTLSDYDELENTTYELYLQKILFEEEHRRELLLEVFGNTIEDSDYESENEIINAFN